MNRAGREQLDMGMEQEQTERTEVKNYSLFSLFPPVKAFGVSAREFTSEYEQHKIVSKTTDRRQIE